MCLEANEILKRYLSAGASERESLRSIVAADPGLVRQIDAIAFECIDRIQSGDAAVELSAALRAISLNDFGMDWRDTLLLLAEGWVRAEKIGIDPKPIFDEIAAISSDQSISSRSMAHTLGHFATYAVLAERRRREE